MRVLIVAYTLGALFIATGLWFHATTYRVDAWFHTYHCAERMEGTRGLAIIYTNKGKGRLIPWCD